MNQSFCISTSWTLINTWVSNSADPGQRAPIGAVWSSLYSLTNSSVNYKLVYMYSVEIVLCAAQLVVCCVCCVSFHLYVLFISYKFAKGFLAITFLLLVFSNWNLHYVRQCFLCSQKLNYSWVRQKTKNFPIDPYCKNCPLW